MNEKEKKMFQKFQEECRHYLYEKSALKTLEKRFVNVNRSGICCSAETKREDPLKKYRLLQSHVCHVDRVFAALERKYGSNVSKMIKEEMTEARAVEEPFEIDESHQKSIVRVLRMQRSWL